MSKLSRFFAQWRQYRAFKRLSRDQRTIVVFAESHQDWHHHATVIDELTGRLGRTICYVASDYVDPGLHQDNPRILPFCVGAGLFRILFFQTLPAGVMLTQLLDLNNLDLKRSVQLVQSFQNHHLIDAQYLHWWIVP